MRIPGAGKFRKQICLFPVFLFAAIVHAQTNNIYFRFTDGTESSYPLTEVRKISFNGNQVHLGMLNGTQYSWTSSSIDYYRYLETATTATGEISFADPWKLQIFPNPSIGRQCVKFRIPSSGDVRITAFDAHGKEVFLGDYPGLQKGYNETSISWPSELPAGCYRIHLKSKDFSVTGTVIRPAL